MNTNLKYSPNYENYKKKDIWILQDAVCLLINVNPLEKKRIFDRNKKIRDEYFDILDTAEKAEDRRMFVKKDYYSGFRDAEVWPEKFIKWANSKGYAIPEPLLFLLHEKVDVDITSASNEVEVQLKHAPELLKIAIEAWKRVWVDKELGEKPGQKKIIPWLQDEFKGSQNRNISDRESRLIDQIIRPSEMKSGARSNDK